MHFSTKLAVVGRRVVVVLRVGRVVEVQSQLGAGVVGGFFVAVTSTIQIVVYAGVNLLQKLLTFALCTFGFVRPVAYLPFFIPV